jgi:hypothetical protein
MPAHFDLLFHSDRKNKGLERLLHFSRKVSNLYCGCRIFSTTCSRAILRAAWSVVCSLLWTA